MSHLPFSEDCTLRQMWRIGDSGIRSTTSPLRKSNVDTLSEQLQSRTRSFQVESPTVHHSPLLLTSPRHQTQDNYSAMAATISHLEQQIKVKDMEYQKLLMESQALLDRLSEQFHCQFDTFSQAVNAFSSKPTETIHTPTDEPGRQNSGALLHEIVSRDNEIDELTSSLKQLQIKYKAAQLKEQQFFNDSASELDQLRKETIKLRQIIDDMRSQNQVLTRSIRSKDDALSSQTAEMELIKKELAASKQDVTYLDQQIALKDDEISKISNELHQIKTKHMDEAEEQNRTMREQITKKDEEISRISNEFMELKAKMIDQSEDRNRSLSEEITKKDEEISRISRELSDLKAKREDESNRLIASLNEQIAQKDEEISRMSRELSNLQTKFATENDIVVSKLSESGISQEQEKIEAQPETSSKPPVEKDLPVSHEHEDPPSHGEEIAKSNAERDKVLETLTKSGILESNEDTTRREKPKEKVQINTRSPVTRAASAHASPMKAVVAKSGKPYASVLSDLEQKSVSPSRDRKSIVDMLVRTSMQYVKEQSRALQSDSQTEVELVSDDDSVEAKPKSKKGRPKTENEMERICEENESLMLEIQRLEQESADSYQEWSDIVASKDHKIKSMRSKVENLEALVKQLQSDVVACQKTIRSQEDRIEQEKSVNSSLKQKLLDSETTSRRRRRDSKSKDGDKVETIKELREKSEGIKSQYEKTIAKLEDELKQAQDEYKVVFDELTATSAAKKELAMEKAKIYVSEKALRMKVESLSSSLERSQEEYQTRKSEMLSTFRDTLETKEKELRQYKSALHSIASRFGGSHAKSMDVDQATALINSGIDEIVGRKQARKSTAHSQVLDV